MKMPLNVAAWIQFQLYLITIDRYSPESIYTSAYKLSEDPSVAGNWPLMPFIGVVYAA